MSRNWATTPLGAWANAQPVRRLADIVDFNAFRSSSARWRLEIEPRAVGALEKFDRRIGLLPSASVVDLTGFLAVKRA